MGFAGNNKNVVRLAVLALRVSVLNVSSAVLKTCLWNRKPICSLQLCILNYTACSSSRFFVCVNKQKQAPPLTRNTEVGCLFYLDIFVVARRGNISGMWDQQESCSADTCFQFWLPGTAVPRYSLGLFQKEILMSAQINNKGCLWWLF